MCKEFSKQKIMAPVKDVVLSTFLFISIMDNAVKTFKQDT